MYFCRWGVGVCCLDLLKEKWDKQLSVRWTEVPKGAFHYSILYRNYRVDRKLATRDRLFSQ